MNFLNLSYGIDYTYSYPYGYWSEPQIKVIKGDYTGLIFDVMLSGLSKINTDPDFKFTYSYKILKMWDSAEQTKVKIILSEKDAEFISDLILSMIKRMNDKPK